jgi:hypothetical protein
MYRSHQDDSDQSLVCLVWSPDESFRVPVDLSHWILGLWKFSSIYTSLTLESTSPTPSSHHPFVPCTKRREEEKGREDMGDEGIPSPIIVVPLHELVATLRIMPSTFLLLR